MVRSIRSLRTAALALVAALALAPSLAAAAPGDAPARAQAAFEASHGKVRALAGERGKAEALQAEVDALLDYGDLARESLGGAARYAERCEPRCDEFEAVLTRLIRENYLKRLRSERSHSVEVVGAEARPRGAYVKTRVRYTEVGGKEAVMEVDYVMHEVDGRWQVRDIVTDGVSLARNYKYEFNQVIRREGIDGLIARLESKVALVARKE